MFAFVTGPEYRLPFGTFTICRFRKNHVHRDVQSLSWTEPMDLSVSVPALDLAAIHPANNDNERVA
ncbi:MULTISPECIES: hypothetical protein [unclassified Bradyrhizobium]|uniref:hypothetical protein n=1 Tax=unclassified Bradyrhizobium TaxID=2631580 RepID=UPI0029167406|nr:MULTISPECIES: hypothetical protein [unclassified Bradyrhizobium]